MTTPPVAGALQDRYRVIRQLGAGGMASVWLGEDLRHGRDVAIKVLHAAIARALGADRFLREIRICARLAHPHILPLIDSGEAGGFLYYVMPYVTGGSLRERLAASARLPVGDALRILAEIGGALDYAHRAGIVHRDVKPENILFAEGLAVLADFGIARASGPEGITDAGMVLGTPEYMSPEQAAGDTDIGPASDVYSLACVAYEMLAGEPPLRGDSARATMARQVTEIPRPVRSLRPDVPAGTADVLARALAKDPRERFSTAAAFVAALDDGREPARPWTSRVIAVLPFVNASPDPGNEYLSDGITDELIDALARVEGLRVAARGSVFALKGKPADVRSVGALLGATWVLEGAVRRQGNMLRVTTQLSSASDGSVLWSDRFDRTLEDVFAIQEDIARTIVDTLRSRALADVATPLPRRRTPSLEAYSLYLKGRYAWNKRTQADIAEAITCFEQAIAADPEYAQAYTGLADAYALSLDYRDVPVTEGFEKAEVYARKALALDDTVAEAHASLAWTLFIHQWRWDESHAEFRRAIQLDPLYATARQWYSFWLAAMARHDEALAESHRAQELDPASVSIRRSVGWVYYYARRFEQARHHLERAIAMNPVADETYRILALTAAMEHQWGDAEHAIGEALKLHDGTYNRATFGYIVASQGRHEEARVILADLTARSAREYVSPVAFATLHLGLGNPDDALHWIERSIAERRGWPAYLRVHPIVDPLRRHPGFANLLAAMRL